MTEKIAVAPLHPGSAGTLEETEYSSSHAQETPWTAAAERWLERYGDLLYRFALLRTRDPHVAEDLVQETLLAALKSWLSFAGRSTVQTWLVGILKHKVYEYFRSLSRRAHTFRDPVAGPGPAFGHADGASEPQRWAERKEFWRVLGEGLARLPARQAALFVLREVDGYSTQELCELFAITPNNVWVLLHRARRSLRDFFMLRMQRINN